ncbi:PP2C family protein-serine/threonine phosphatase [Piscinibacter terrae]|uniref:Serine/threonine-protein phosphatase n=1 Tax=Piscinibacter terrae TaxID=2496871 RepID=A0A3N7HSW1_9BURK|nr:protein phosphatase 2C domain-containing protein [Albitalea terrae]RQP25388.1 serine/threonine-protein phosphatase [Albitalea terrae]
MVEIQVAALSELGQRDVNEDKVHVSRDGGRWVALLADGAGGHRNGAEASRRAMESLEMSLVQASPPFDAQALTQAMLAAHAHVQQGQDSDSSGQGRMHSTVVALWIDAAAELALWSHVGDSRLYRVRDGMLSQLTVDDSIVQRMVEAGVLSEAQAAEHPLKNQLMAALGIDDEIDPHTTARPVAVHEGDAFLLCSDGWWGALGEGAIVDALAGAESLEEWLSGMKGRIEARAWPKQDNFSAVGVWVGEAGEWTRPMGV